jgi:PAS domain-containing protein
MADSVTDLGGWRVGAEEFLAAVLRTAAQPIWVVDPDGLIRFANPAAISALGYDSADELFGRPQPRDHPLPAPRRGALSRCGLPDAAATDDGGDG